MNNVAPTVATSAEVLHVASECACCGKSLDFEAQHESVSWGIGPDCRRKHGFDKADIGADWGRALGYLGPDCPSHIYEAVVAAHGTRKGFGPDDETGVDTTRADVQTAIKALVLAIAVAPQARASKEDVMRYVLAINALGHRKLASILAKSFIRRVQFRTLFPVVVAIVNKVAEGTYEIRNTYNFRLMGSLRTLPNCTWDKIRKVRTVRNAKPEAIFAAIKAGGADLIAGDKGVVLGHDLPASTAPAFVCWTDPCRAEDRVCWVNVETGELVRYALPGEPTHRPGLERVPAIYFATGVQAHEQLGKAVA